jgi:hyaluronan synthase
VSRRIRGLSYRFRQSAKSQISDQSFPIHLAQAARSPTHSGRQHENKFKQAAWPLSSVGSAFLNFVVRSGPVAVLGALILEGLVSIGTNVLTAQAVQLAIILALTFIFDSMVRWPRQPAKNRPLPGMWFFITRAATQGLSWIVFAYLIIASMNDQIANALCFTGVMAVNFIISETCVARLDTSNFDCELAAGHNLDIPRQRSSEDATARSSKSGFLTSDYRDSKDTFHDPVSADRHRDNVGQFSHGNGNFCSGGAVPLAAREAAPGALRDHYQIPKVTYSRKKARGLALSSILVTAWVTWHLGWESLALGLCAGPAIGFRALNWMLSWFDEPSAVKSTADIRRLERLHVTVAVPVFNEDPGLLDRCLYSLVNQTRLPQLVCVVDDGSNIDYTILRRHWERIWHGETEIRWARQTNQGKRRAHAVAFESVHEADVFVTVDSDTTLDRSAIEEGLKPFRHRDIMSVAGIEMGFNATTNLLTRLQCSLQLYAQGVIGAAWSVAGDMYTNRGPFALYRASVVRECLPVYKDEVFFGRRVILGDDSLLALCATARGRSVQQLSAFGLTMWPEKLGHHLRQRIRWARGRTMRNFWRIKYRPILSYGWWFTIAGIYSFLFSTCVLVLIGLWWPSSAPFIKRGLIALLLLSIPNSLRSLCFKRSDESRTDRILLLLVRPLAGLWSSLVLARLVRLWGTMTMLRQGWTTRQHGAELLLGPVDETDAAASWEKV